MSAESLRLPEYDRPSRSRRPALRPVDRAVARRRPRLAYALLALAGAGIIAVAQIGLTIATTHDSFTLSELTSQKRDLSLQSQALQEELAGITSPQSLASKASGLGMVVAGTASYLRLSDDSVSGQATGAGPTSSVDPRGSGAVANALLVKPAPPATAADAEKAEAEKSADESAVPDIPPSLDKGLPTPSTH